MVRVLLVEDEPEMARLVAAKVGGAGYVVDRVASLEEARSACAVVPYAVVLLDRRLPDGDGATLLPELRRLRPTAAVILVSALDAVSDRVAGLDAGADDYLAKPFDAAELLARIRSALRRPMAPPPPVTVGALTFDLAERQAAIRGVPLVLRRRELGLLEALIRRAGRVVQRETLVDEIFGFDDDIQSNTLDAHVSRLRARLAEAEAGVAIHPVRGVGYLLGRA